MSDSVVIKTFDSKKTFWVGKHQHAHEKVQPGLLTQYPRFFLDLGFSGIFIPFSSFFFSFLVLFVYIQFLASNQITFLRGKAMRNETF